MVNDERYLQCKPRPNHNPFFTVSVGWGNYPHVFHGMGSLSAPEGSFECIWPALVLVPSLPWPTWSNRTTHLPYPTNEYVSVQAGWFLAIVDPAITSQPQNIQLAHLRLVCHMDSNWVPCFLPGGGSRGCRSYGLCLFGRRTCNRLLPTRVGGPCIIWISTTGTRSFNTLADTICGGWRDPFSRATSTVASE